jgi:heat shock protein HtpX
MASMYELIAANKRNSWVLASLVFLVLVALGALIGMALAGGDPAGAVVGLVIAGTIAFVLTLAGFYGGDSIVLSMNGAREITHAMHPQLFNVVEELSIASGLPMPKVYLIDDSAPNAFATGRDPAHASVAITSGLLEKLDRNELQGVMAHEMSHVRNYDIRFAMLMVVLVGTIVLLSDMFLRMLRGTRLRSRGKGGGAAMLVIIILAVIFAILAPIFAMLIQLAVSRQREYLADASAADMTRYPEGLAGALEKIQADHEPLEVANRATAHLYIVNPIMKLKGRATDSLWNSHPPIDDRIQRLREMV